jgi:hypothetical protein
MSGSDDGLTGLAIAQRLQDIQQKIDAKFLKVNSDTINQWTLNGAQKYKLLGIDDHKLIQALINNAPKSQENFYVMDLGAGNFEWCKAVAKYISTQNFERNFKLHIVGVRGEQYLEKEVAEVSNSIVHQYGSFKIENFCESMKERGLQDVYLILSFLAPLYVI